MTAALLQMFMFAVVACVWAFVSKSEKIKSDDKARTIVVHN